MTTVTAPTARPPRASTANAAVSLSLAGFALIMDLGVSALLYAPVLDAAAPDAPPGSGEVMALLLGGSILVGIVSLACGIAAIVTGAIAIRGRRRLGITGVALGALTTPTSAAPIATLFIAAARA